MNVVRKLAYVGLAVLVAASTAIPAASAEPDPGAGASVQIALAATGVSDTVVLPGLQASRSLTVPVPVGAVPRELRARITAPPFVDTVTLDVVQDDRTLSRTVVTRPAAGAPITLPLTGLTPTRPGTPVTVRTWLQTQGQCLFDDADAVRLSETTVAYAAPPAQPASAADFLPPVLTGLTLYLPEQPSRAEGATAVRLIAALAAHYPGAPTAVTVVPLPAGGPRGTRAPFDRQIVIAGNQPRGFELRTGPDGAYATLGGDDGDLDRTAALLTSDLAPLAAATGVLAKQAWPAPQLPATARTLNELGMGTLTTTARYRPTVHVGIDQSQLGAPSRDVRVRLAGSYTPGAQGEAGRVVVTVGDRTLATWPADGTGTFDRWIDVPNDLLARYTDVTVALDRPVDPGGCGQGRSATLTVDGASEIRRTLASPPAPGGFQSLPQALMPRLQVAWTHGDLADVRRAALIVAAMGRMSRSPLGIDVVDFDAAVKSSTPALVIDADGARSADLPLRVRAGAGNTVRATAPDGSTVDLDLTPQLRFGSIQVVVAGGRSVVVAGSTGVPRLLDQALDWLSADPARWSTRTGDVLIQTANGDPAMLATTAPSATAERSERAGWLIPAVAAGGAALLAAVAVFVMRRRRGDGRG